MSNRVSREALILDRLAKDGAVSVADLSTDLGVSEVTIRTSLRSLEGKGFLARNPGGAQGSSYQTVLERQRIRAQQKAQIGLAAASLVRDHDSLMVEAGTTAMMVMRSLGGRQGVQVVSNSALAIPAGRLNPELRLVLCGGHFNHESESMVGSEAVNTVRQYNCRLAFIGTDGFSAERGLTTQFSAGVDVIRAMHQQAEETWLLADSSKYGKAGFVKVLPLAEISGVITDREISPLAVEELRDLAIRVIIA